MGDVDGGWAWLFMMATFLLNAVVMGMVKGQGIIFVQYQQIFGASAATTAWIGATYSLAFTLTAPVAGYLSDRISLRHNRHLVMGAGVVITMSLVVAALVPGVKPAIVLLGLVPGAGVGVVFPVVHSIQLQFFVRRRFLASAASAVGSPLGALVFPPLITYTVQELGIQGALLLLAGIHLHLVAVGAAIKPTEQIERTRRQSPGGVANNKQVLGNVTHSKQSPGGVAGHEQSLEGVVGLKHSPAGVVNQKQTLGGVQCHSQSLEGDISSKQSLGGVTDQNKSAAQAHKQSPCGLTNTDCSVVVIGTRHRVRPLGADPSPPSPLPPYPPVGLRTALTDYHAVLCSPGLLTLALSFTCAMFATYNQFFLMPSLAAELGVTPARAALLTALPGVTEIFARSGTALAVRLELVRPRVVVGAAFCLCLVAGLTASFLLSPDLLLGYALLFGLLGGVHACFMIPLLAELVPARLVATLIGLNPIIINLGTFIGPPVFSAMRAHTVSYVAAFQLCVSGYAAAAALLALHVWQRRRHHKVTSSDQTAVTVTPSDQKGNFADRATPREQSGNMADTATPSDQTGNFADRATPREQSGNMADTATPSDQKGNLAVTVTPSDQSVNLGCTATPNDETENLVVTVTPREQSQNLGETATPSEHSEKLGDTATPSYQAGKLGDTATTSDQEMNQSNTAPLVSYL